MFTAERRPRRAPYEGRRTAPNEKMKKKEHKETTKTSKESNKTNQMSKQAKLHNIAVK